jgi:hypothetical protein
LCDFLRPRVLETLTCKLYDQLYICDRVLKGSETIARKGLYQFHAEDSATNQFTLSVP